MNLWINRINSALAISFYALFFFVPLIIYSKSYELFEFNKMWLTFGITIVVGFLWISKMILEGRIIFRRTPLDIPILIFFISQFLSTIISLDTHTSIWGFYSRFNGGFLSTVAYLTLYYAMASNLLGSKPENSENSANQRTQNHAKNKPLSNILSFLSPQSSSIPFSFKLLVISLLSGTVVAFWGAPSHFGYDPTCLLFRGEFNVDCWTAAFQPTVRIFSTLGQPNWMATYISILLLPLIGLTIALISHAFSDTNERIKNHELRIMDKVKKLNPLILASCFLILLSYYCLIWTRSQSGFLGFWVGFVAFAALIKLTLFKQFGFSVSKFWEQTSIKILAALVVLFLAINFFTGFPIERLNAFTLPELVKKEVVQPKTSGSETALSEVGGTNSGQIRLIVWRGAIDIFKHNPILGSGVETFAYSYYKYRPAAHNNTSEWDYLYNKAHNEYLNYAATTGILGIGSYLFIIGLFLWTSVRYILRLDARDLRFDNEARDSKLEKKTQSSIVKSQVLTSSFQRPASTLLALSLIGSYISILVSNFFGFSVVIVNIFFFLIPLFVYELLGYPGMSKTRSENLNEKPADMLRIVGIVIVGVVGLYMLATLLKFWEADKAYSLGYNLNRLGEYTEATPQLITATKLRPSEPIFQDELAINLGTLALVAAGSDQATQAAQLAKESKMLSDNLVRNNPNNVVFYKSRTRILYGLSQIDPKYLTAALDSVEKASKLAPTDPKIVYNKALLYGEAGDKAQAIDLLNQTIQLKKDYRDAYYALAVYYLQDAKAQEATNSAQAQLKKDQAKQLLEYTLTHIASDDPKSRELLKSIQ